MNVQCKVENTGGLQKEAFFNKKFCITLRDETEWVELVESGYNILTGAEKDVIIDTYQSLISRPFTEAKNYYGNGNASHKIIDTLLQNANG